MNYFIDGYNMLFCLNRSFKALQQEREFLLEELNNKASLLNLNISIIFDASYQMGGRNRSYFNALEIIYTAQGESADEYLVDMTLQLSNPRQMTVITNDKILASHLRHASVKIETVEYFTQWLNRSYAKRLKSPKEKKILTPPAIAPSPPKVVIEPVSSEKISEETDLEYYQRIFEAELEVLQKLEKSKNRPEKKVRKPKTRQDPFDVPRIIKREATETERWLKAFEQNFEGLR